MFSKLMSSFKGVTKNNLQSNISLQTQNEDAWELKLRIYTRDQAVKVSAYLAKNIDKDFLNQNRLSVGVIGGFNTGKSLIFDTIAFGFIDNKNPYKVPQRDRMFLEHKQCEAFEKPMSNFFKINNKKLNVLFVNQASFSKLDVRTYKSSANIVFISSVQFFSLFPFIISGPQIPGQLTKVIKHTDLSMIISLRQENAEDNIWNKTWTICFAPELRTPEMKKVLEHLRGVNQRISARYNQEPLTQEPAIAS